MANGSLILSATGDVAFSPAGLVAGSGWKSVAFDLSAYFAKSYREGVLLTALTKFASAPTAGGLLRIGIAWKLTGTTYAGGLASGDAALVDTTRFSQFDELSPMVAGNDTNAQGCAQQVIPLSPYGILCVLNSASTNLSATAADHIFTFTNLGRR